MDSPLSKRLRLEFDYSSSAPSIENQKKSIIIVWMSQTFGFGTACRQWHAAFAKQVLFSPRGIVFPNCFSAAVHWQHLHHFFRFGSRQTLQLRWGEGLRTPCPPLTVAPVSMTSDKKMASAVLFLLPPSKDQDGSSGLESACLILLDRPRGGVPESEPLCKSRRITRWMVEAHEILG